MRKEVCDYDCEHCKFPDCINNNPPTKGERKKLEVALSEEWEKQRDAEINSWREYYKTHREKVLATNRRSYAKHAEKRKAYSMRVQKERYHNDPEYREKIKQKARERYWKKKGEKI